MPSPGWHNGARLGNEFGILPRRLAERRILDTSGRRVGYRVCLRGLALGLLHSQRQLLPICELDVHCRSTRFGFRCRPGGGIANALPCCRVRRKRSLGTQLHGGIIRIFIYFGGATVAICSLSLHFFGAIYWLLACALRG